MASYTLPPVGEALVEEVYERNNLLRLHLLPFGVFAKHADLFEFTQTLDRPCWCGGKKPEDTGDEELVHAECPAHSWVSFTLYSNGRTLRIGTRLYANAPKPHAEPLSGSFLVVLPVTPVADGWSYNYRDTLWFRSESEAYAHIAAVAGKRYRECKCPRVCHPHSWQVLDFEKGTSKRLQSREDLERARAGGNATLVKPARASDEPATDDCA